MKLHITNLTAKPTVGTSTKWN